MLNLTKDLVVVALFWAVPVWFFWLILKKAGYSPWWSLVSLIPWLGEMVLLAYLALVPWPSKNGTEPAPSGRS